ncbi:glycosyltransferase family 39 protein [Patescibacteria group bacterium]|nr:glycosyltransferase family 39 protein [Patescibacteria group bacterium]
MRRLRTIIALSLVWFLIFLGVFLRSYKADVYPVDNNDDGLFYAWAGLSLYDNPLKPMSHSIFDKDNPALIWRSQFMDFQPLDRFGLKLTQPWLDHPPLATLVIALPAKLLGYKTFELIPQIIVRYPAIIASIFTLWLTYLLALKLFNRSVGLWSLAFLATVPYFVVAHRQSFLENFLTPVFLGSWLAYLNKKYKLAMVLSFLTGWIKVPGFSVPFMFALKSRRFALVGVASILTYLGYGWLVGKEFFWQTITNQGVRGAFVNSFYDEISKPHFYGGFADGWYILGFALIFFMLTKFKSEKFKVYNWFMAAWLLVLFLVAGRFNNSPWYYYPLIPFLAINLGYFTAQALKVNNLFMVLPFWLLGLTGFDLIAINIPPLWLRLTTIVFFAPFVLNFKKLAFWWTRLLIVGLILLNIYVNLRFTTVHCLKERCLAPTKIMVNND